jgi:hypothetical protein
MYSCHVQPNPTPNFHHEGRLIPKSNPYFGEIYYMLLAMHLTHSTEQLLLVTEHVVALFEEWEENGLAQPGKYTTVTLRESHFSATWNTFSIGTHDGMMTGCHDFPLILPSNQCEESWHKGLMKLLKGGLRGSTDHVLNVTLPRILLDDTINMPRELCFEPVNINVRCYACSSTTRSHPTNPYTYLTPLLTKLEVLESRCVRRVWSRRLYVSWKRSAL